MPASIDDPDVRAPVGHPLAAYFVRERETPERLVVGQFEFLPRLKESTNVHDA